MTSAWKFEDAGRVWTGEVALAFVVVCWRRASFIAAPLSIWPRSSSTLPGSTFHSGGISATNDAIPHEKRVMPS